MRACIKNGPVKLKLFLKLRFGHDIRIFLGASIIKMLYPHFGKICFIGKKIMIEIEIFLRSFEDTIKKVHLQ